ncbi:MAG: DNA methyltransferase, partial [Cyanobacteria bacterium J06598_3]
MAASFELNMEAAIAQLRSHNLQTLFTSTLGWQPTEPNQPEPNHSAQPASLQIFQQTCRPIAHRDNKTVWQVSLTAKTQFTHDLRRRIYSGITALSDPDADIPLVIFIDAAKTRSLWCQSPQENALYVTGSPTELWQFRLRRLAQAGNNGSNSSASQFLFPTYDVAEKEARYDTFQKLLKQLCEGITGISNLADRQAYGALTLRRLILVQSLQQRGWLAGDTWYLQTRFGQALQQGKDLFFRGCLQPLYKSLAMPAMERPLPLQNNVGDVPFLGPLFDSHRLEQQYGAIAIYDQPFEEILGWLSEQANAELLNPWMSRELGHLLERYYTEQHYSQQPTDCLNSTPQTNRLMCEQSLEKLIVQKLQAYSRPQSSTSKGATSKRKQQNKTNAVIKKSAIEISADPSGEGATLNDVLFNANTKLCRQLIQEILPKLRILDPACGTGNLLVATHQKLTEIFSVLTGYIQQTQDTQLKIWQSGLSEEIAGTAAHYVTAQEPEAAPNLIQNLQSRILKNNIYGVDISASSAETTRWQLLLHTIATARNRSDIEPLTDLAFNIMTGNSLIGLVKVDEERFDQVNSAQPGSLLQGNLLQPLAADGYQTILAEKNLALEHYKSRNQMLAEARTIPEYARASLLREEIAKLDAKAQYKLDTLLLNHMSQQLGIQYKAAQLTKRPQRQPLTREDIDVLEPFHWGYHFNDIIQRGGFDIVLCAPPWGPFKPTVEEFLQRFQDLAEGKCLSAITF